MPEARDGRRSRRDFLRSGAALAVVGAVPAAVPPPARPTALSGDGGLDRPARPGASGPEVGPPEIGPDTIAQAEKLAGIGFTPTERETMRETIGEQIDRFRERATQPLLPNTLAPALRFDPRLPGMTFDTARRPIVRWGEEAPPLPTSEEDIAFAPVTALSRWIQSGQLTSRALTDLYLGRLKRADTALACVVTFTENLARAQAARADREIAVGRYRGPLHGIPWGAKDLLDTKGIRTTWGAEPYINRVPDSDATVVRKLDDAGAVLIAKLSLGALAYGDIWFGGRTNSPWKPERGSSGSSAGSACATAAGLVGFAIGTETYGSITSPCMVCGTTGLRPTFGRVSRAGAMALCWSLDKIGPIARTVEDCALVLDAINGPDAGDPSTIDLPFNFDGTRPVRGLRLGWFPSVFAEKDAHELDRKALDIAKGLGLELVELDLPDWPYGTLLNILTCEAAAAFEELTRSNQDDQLTWQAPEAWPNTFRQAWFIPGIELVQADRFRRRVMQMMAERFAKVDAIITPSLVGQLCLITNNTGHPSITLRCGMKDDGTPYGITLLGRLFDEGTICSIGMALEKAFAVWDKRPAP